MRRYIFLIFILSLIWLSSCATQRQIPINDVTAPVSDVGMSGEDIPIPSVWSDPGTGYRLGFYEGGELLFCRDSEEREATYELNNERLIIYFDDHTTQEASYKIENDKLIITWSSDMTSYMAMVESPEYIASLNGQEEETPEPTAPQGPFPYRFITENYTAYPIAHIPTEFSSQIRVLEDTLGNLHAFYIDEKANLAHRLFDGTGWAEPQIISKREDAPNNTNWISDFFPIKTPSGEMAVVLRLGKSTNTLYAIACYRNGSWIEETVLAMPDRALSGNFFVPFFDAQGTLHIVHDRICVDESKSGIYLDDVQLARRYKNEDGLTAYDGLLPGLSAGIIYPHIHPGTESTDTVYLAGFIEEGRIRDPNNTVETWIKTYNYVYSVSQDGGQTWRGPYTAYKGIIESVYFDSAYDAQGNRTTMIDGSTTDIDHNPELLLIQIGADGSSVVNGYFNQVELEQKWLIEKDQRYAPPDFYVPTFKSIQCVQDGSLHFLGQEIFLNVHIVLTPDKIMQIAQTDVPFAMDNMLVLQNGKTAFYGADADSSDQMYKIYIQND